MNGEYYLVALALARLQAAGPYLIFTQERADHLFFRTRPPTPVTRYVICRHVVRFSRNTKCKTTALQLL